MARLILSMNGQNMAEYNMGKERYTVGRLSDNDVRIDNPAVSGHHSLIINILNDSFLEDLNSTNGTYVNGKLIKKHALQHDDVVTVGKHQLTYIDADNEQEEEDDEFARTMVIDSSEMANRINGADSAKVAAPSVAAAAADEETVARDEKTIGEQKGAKPLTVAKIQVLNGTFAGREILLNKAVTTLGRASAQVIAITRRAEGYSIVKVENEEGRKPPSINGKPLEDQARRLKDNDVIQIIGIKMGFFSD
jgi:pSer/pThr/pTyr-binding forkhead associated (FHA) protein